MGKKPELKILSESEYPLWQKFLEETPQSTIYSDPDYLEILCSATNDSFHIAAVFSGGEMESPCQSCIMKRGQWEAVKRGNLKDRRKDDIMQ